MKIRINDSNYGKYKKIFEIMHSHIRKLMPYSLDPAADPMNILENWKTKNKTIASRGLKIGLSDMISQIKEFPDELKLAIDKDLSANQLPVLKVLQGITERTIRNVLKRGKINSLAEYYTVKEEVVDAGTGYSEEERKTLDRYMAAFEQSRKK